MPLGNTRTDYGSLTKSLHWLTALLILSALPLGFLAQQAPMADGAEIAAKAQLFSLHKTVGLAAFLVAALRILWALTQTRPGLLNSDNRLEALAAHSTHWLLYGAMLLVPLTGWLHHASTSGFAPILWPFGQSLPFIPKSETLADLTSALHFAFMIVLAGAILAHIGGALKHRIIDRDQTLQRMLPGRHSAPAPAAETPGKGPRAVALTVLVAALALGFTAGLTRQQDAPEPSAAALPSVASDWQVSEGRLAITLHQLGSELTGGFADWTAAITFDETATQGRHGSVDVQIATGSLSLGSVTAQALGADFLDAARFGTARFSADILAADSGHVARGTLTLRGVSAPVDLPFSLEIRGDTATMTGTTRLDRRTFGIGAAVEDEATLSFGVTIAVTLTAVRAP
ncbi:cytochrome b/b6 domain-containing protein [Shimia sp.]|uniref:cytochrome b/b6 domain-containing protein n=1 Tax=Shimia sp. TaxID=1954381 RepID=UPI00356B5DF6